MSNDELRRRWEARYQSDDRPWDTGITPPEVQAFWAHRTPGRLALDLGCGTGTNAAFLADRNAQTIGVEYAFTALMMARMRLAKRSKPSGWLSFVQGDVARLPFIGLAADYILDIGCFHGVPPADRMLYAQGVIENLRPGGHYHLYAFDRVPAEELSAGSPTWRGFGPDEIVELFHPQLAPVEIIQGEDGRYPSRWYLLQKAGG